MSRYWKVWIAVACILMITTFVVNCWYWPPKIEAAYKRGYFHGAYYAVSIIDGKLNQGGKLISSYKECVLQDSNMFYQEWFNEVDQERRRDSLAAIPDSIYFDSTDTMPVKGRAADWPAVEGTTYVDTFYKRDGVWRSAEEYLKTTTNQPDE